MQLLWRYSPTSSKRKASLSTDVSDDTKECTNDTVTKLVWLLDLVDRIQETLSRTKTNTEISPSSLDGSTCWLRCAHWLRDISEWLVESKWTRLTLSGNACNHHASVILRLNYHYGHAVPVMWRFWVSAIGWIFSFRILAIKRHGPMAWWARRCFISKAIDWIPIVKNVSTCCMQWTNAWNYKSSRKHLSFK